ncbi:helix-turn-helix transcriptional regulator [Serratia ureilytica]|uniref:helix-turn-helix domain-containing protein n=1 Tax=Serratia ureilytica TaxID=300181 RepID=UPI003265E617
MAKIIRIAIVDNNYYFAFGVRCVLSKYFFDKGIFVDYVSEKDASKAIILFQSSAVSRSTTFCRQFHNDKHQSVIVVRDEHGKKHTRRQSPCLRVRGEIDRQIEIDSFLISVEEIISFNFNHGSSTECPRCSHSISYREWQVLCAIQQGLEVDAIALSLKMSQKTVSAHKRNAMNKLGFTRSADLYYWLKIGGLEQEVKVVNEDFL